MKDLVLEQDLLDHLVRVADEVGAAQRPRRLVALAGHRRPATLPADLVHRRRERPERLLDRLSGRVRDEAVRVDADFQL